MSFTNQWPDAACDGLNRLYAGEIFLLPGNESSCAFQRAVLNEVTETLGQDYRQAHTKFDDSDYFRLIGKLRKRIYTSDLFLKQVNAVIQSLGFDLSQHAYDPARLRAIAHNGHLNRAAAPIYHGHRDTWYSNPQSMVTWWIPLHDVSPEETFEFFTDCFSQSVLNDSEVFDFDRWTAVGQQNKIGWQNKDTGRTQTYPRLMESPIGPRVPVQANAGDILLFSGQHLHQTRHNTTGRTRFSLDFRTVHAGHYAADIGPENVDDRSTGSSFTQFVKPIE